MPRSLDLAAIRQPTILEIWAPACVECKAMQPDLDYVAAQFVDRVDMRMVSSAEDLETVRGLGVKATPTLIGVKEGREVFRVIGRRSRSDLHELFEAVALGNPVRRVSSHDVILRVVTGSLLVGVGLAIGSVWPLVALGTAVFIYGVFPMLRSIHE